MSDKIILLQRRNILLLFPPPVSSKHRGNGCRDAIFCVSGFHQPETIAPICRRETQNIASTTIYRFFFDKKTRLLTISRPGRSYDGDITVRGLVKYAGFYKIAACVKRYYIVGAV
jgi:hypothetical protein